MVFLAIILFFLYLNSVKIMLITNKYKYQKLYYSFKKFYIMHFLEIYL